MAARTRRSAQRTGPDAEPREINLSGFDDAELQQLAVEHAVELPADADRERVIEILTDAIAAREAQAAEEAAKAAADADPADPPDPAAGGAGAGDEPPAAPRPRRRSSSGPVATRNILHAGRIIEAGEHLPSDFPEELLAQHYEAGTIE